MGRALATILTAIMNKEFAVIGREYDRAVRTEHAGGRGGWGTSFVEAEWMSLHAAFPRATLRVHHTIGRQNSC